MCAANRKRDENTELDSVPFLLSLKSINSLFFLFSPEKKKPTNFEKTMKGIWFIYSLQDKCAGRWLGFTVSLFKRNLITKSETPTALSFYNISSLQCTLRLRFLHLFVDPRAEFTSDEEGKREKVILLSCEIINRSSVLAIINARWMSSKRNNITIM